MFEDVADAELIEVMGEASRDESTAIAPRLLAVGELYARRAAERAEIKFWSTDVTDLVAAGFGILPAESVRELATTAKLKPLTIPTGAAPDPGYRPSAATREFIRWRDLTCRWPGCDRPVQKSDIDHTVPYPVGPTHPSNNKPYCRIQDRHRHLRSDHRPPGS